MGRSQAVRHGFGPAIPGSSPGAPAIASRDRSPRPRSSGDGRRARDAHALVARRTPAPAARPARGRLGDRVGAGAGADPVVVAPHPTRRTPTRTSRRRAGARAGPATPSPPPVRRSRVSRSRSRARRRRAAPHRRAPRRAGREHQRAGGRGDDPDIRAAGALPTDGSSAATTARSRRSSRTGRPAGASARSAS